MINFDFKRGPIDLGFLPMFLNPNSPDPATVQLDRSYAHGGGWRPQKGFVMLPNGSLRYPGDEPMPVLAEAKLGDEIIRVYDFSYIAVVQPDGSFEACRMD